MNKEEFFKRDQIFTASCHADAHLSAGNGFPAGKLHFVENPFRRQYIALVHTRSFDGDVLSGIAEDKFQQTHAA